MPPNTPVLTALLALALASLPARADFSFNTPLVLKGTVVTMDDAYKVVNGAVVVKNGKIESILEGAAQPPAGAIVIDTKGFIFPGLMNLHNHIAYNFLPLYPVPKHYDNRDQWPGGALYEQLVNNPKTLVTDPSLYGRETEALKYAEIKSLVGGETTTQGSPQNAGTASQLCRNVELPNFGRDSIGQRGLPIDAMFTKELAANQASVAKLDAWFFHLSEGISDYSRREYYNPNYDPAKNPGTNNQAGLKNLKLVLKNLVGIHSAALTEADYKDWKTTAGGPPKIVWSPLSNLLLYGKTTNVPAAVKHGAIVAIGSDWSPSGSKNVLYELKFAAEVNRQLWNSKFTRKDLVAMVTRNPARIVNWQDKVGSIKAGMVADLMVVDKRVTDPYQSLIDARENNVQLVLVNGNPLYGDAAHMKVLKSGAEQIGTPGGRVKMLDLKHLKDDAGKPIPKGDQSFKDITKALLDALRYDPQVLADQLNKGRGPPGPAQFKDRTNIKAWLQKELTKEHKPVPADVTNVASPISAATVAIYFKEKYPNARPITKLDPIYHLGDDAFFNGIKNNLHFNGSVAKVLDLTTFMKYSRP